MARAAGFYLLGAETALDRGIFAVFPVPMAWVYCVYGLHVLQIIQLLQMEMSHD
jgi:hypothetical protein